MLDGKENHKCMMGTGSLALGSALTRPTFLFLRAYISCSNSSFLGRICTNSALPFGFYQWQHNLLLLHHYTLYTTIYYMPLYTTYQYILYSIIYHTSLYTTHHYTLQTTKQYTPYTLNTAIYIIIHCIPFYTTHNYTLYTMCHYTVYTTRHCIPLFSTRHFHHFTLYTIIHYTPLYTT